MMQYRVGNPLYDIKREIKIQWANMCQHMSDLLRKSCTPDNQSVLGEDVVCIYNASACWALKRGSPHYAWHILTN